jgi:sugar/nucleoside kinase (ribokinase family)
VCLYANAVGALTTTQLGAIPALPTAQELSAFLESRDIKINFD